MRKNTLGLICAVLLVPVVSADVQVASIQYLNNSNKLQTVTSKDIKFVSESPAGIKVLFQNKEVVIPAEQIRTVRYRADNVVPYLELSKPFAAADRGELADDPKKAKEEFEEAITGLQQMIPKVNLVPELHRYTLYRLGEIHLAMTKVDKEQSAKHLSDAITAWTEIRDKHPGGWEIVPTLNQLARLQEEAGKVDEAVKTYRYLAKNVDGVPPEMQRESLFTAVQLLLQNKNTKDAKGVLQELKLKLKPEDPQSEKVQLFLAQCTLADGTKAEAGTAMTSVKAIASKSASDETKALAYNTLGDYHQKVGEGEQAFWAYFRVHVQYPGDKYQHAKALHHLSTLFRDVKKDVARANACVEMLKSKEFEGTTYQQLVLEKTPMTP